MAEPTIPSSSAGVYVRWRPIPLVWSLWSIAASTVAAWAAWTHPELLSSPAYAVTLEIAPWPLWGSVWAAAAAAIGLGLVSGWRPLWRLGHVLFIVPQTIQGWSILVLPVQTALLGTVQWWGGAVLSLVVLLEPTSGYRWKS